MSNAGILDSKTGGNFEMIKICPIDNEPIEAIILTWLNMNCPLIVRCKLEVMNGNKCPKKKIYLRFPIEPRKEGSRWLTILK